ncbi:MAG: low molecular weight phosphotyrosine protein phosphatase [Clostridia bacterium]|nr:low molecular weight phosphotyrosine protein phosphatase [Clostridia bacterium]
MDILRVVFVCHGNICRSPTAEFVFKKILLDRGLEKRVEVTSRAMTRDEIGNHIYPPARRVLSAHSVPFDPDKRATLFTFDDYRKNDLVLAMDSENLDDLNYATSSDPDGKVKTLTAAAGMNGEIEDPWYTGNFEKVFSLIEKACLTLADSLFKR